MLLHRKPVAKTQRKGKEEPQPFSRSAVDKYYVALTKKQGRLLYFRDAADLEFEGDLPLPKNMLRKYHEFSIETSIQDGQCCLFSNWVLDLLDRMPTISSIQGELIPFLVAKQAEGDIPELGKKQRFPCTHTL